MCPVRLLSLPTFIRSGLFLNDSFTWFFFSLSLSLSLSLLNSFYFLLMMANVCPESQHAKSFARFMWGGGTLQRCEKWWWAALNLKHTTQQSRFQQQPKCVISEQQTQKKKKKERIRKKKFGFKIFFNYVYWRIPFTTKKKKKILKDYKIFPK